MYAVNWNDITETENLPNNFRVAVAGKEMGINRIRWVHPTTLPPHSHPDAEQAIVVLEGVISLTIANETLTLGAGDVAVIPRNVVHSGESIEGAAVFVEVFAPLRLENLYGFLGDSSVAPGEA